MGNIANMLCSNCNPQPGTPMSDLEGSRRQKGSRKNILKKKKDLQSLAMKTAVTDIRKKFGIEDQGYSENQNSSQDRQKELSYQIITIAREQSPQNSVAKFGSSHTRIQKMDFRGNQSDSE